MSHGRCEQELSSRLVAGVVGVAERHRTAHRSCVFSPLPRPCGDSRGAEGRKDTMDTGEYISTMDNMDPTLAELGDEFTLGDIDGE